MAILATVFLALLGAVLASFLMLVAERLHAGEGWARGRSRCNGCARTLSLGDLVPILSYVFARGTCRTCGYRIPAAYAIGEGTLGSLFALSYHAVPDPFLLASLLVALSVLFLIVVYDLRHMIVPRVPSAFLALAALLYAALASPTLPALGLSLAAAGGAGFFFLAFHALSRGRAMGLGDAPVAFSLALLVGAEAVVPGILFSFWTGAFVGIAVLVVRQEGHRMGTEVPFVPFLAAGFLLAYFTSWNPLPLF